MSELTAQQAAERIEAALRESTPGRWCKGQTTHHTVAKFTDGKKPYTIGEFHHAVDAEFAERCHELLPILLAERRELLARQVPEWIDASKVMPDPCVTVLAFYKNSLGNGRRIRAQWVPTKTVESGSESEAGEYDEEADVYFDREGWYEQMDNWPEYSSALVTEGAVLCWMPLPAAPKAES